MKKTVLFLLLLACTAFLFVGCGEDETGGIGGGGAGNKVQDGLIYELNEDGDGYTVTGVGTLTETDVVIPDKHNNKPVTAIGVSAFEGCRSQLTSVEIPDTVTRIERYAFYECKRLTKVVVPDSVTYIGFGAFYHCRELVSISLPFVGESAEAEENTHLRYVFGESIPDALEKVVITGGKEIADNAFLGCGNLVSLELPFGIERIGEHAFASCTKLTTLEIPAGVTEIGTGAFAACEALQTVRFGGTVLEWTALTKDVELGASVGEYKVICSDGEL